MCTPSLQSCQQCLTAWSWQRWQLCSMSLCAAWTSRAPLRRRTLPTRTQPWTDSSSSPVLSWPKSEFSLRLLLKAKPWKCLLATANDVVCWPVVHLLSVYPGAPHVCTKDVRLKPQLWCELNPQLYCLGLYQRWTRFVSVTALQIWTHLEQRTDVFVYYDARLRHKNSLMSIIIWIFNQDL